MLRKAVSSCSLQARMLRLTPRASGFFQNLKEAAQKESEKEKLGLDLEKLKKETDEAGKQFAESEKFAKLKKETAKKSEILEDKISEAAKVVKDKAGIDAGKIGEKLAETFENVKNYEFTQKPEDRMAVFEDDYTALNYQPPAVIRKRKQIDEAHKNIVFDADEESAGVAVHKDYLIYEKIKNSKVGKTFDDLSTRMAASESNLIRGARFLGGSVSNKISKLTSNEFNECMKAIRAVDPTFTQDNFVRFLEKEMIPIVLEASAMNDVEIVDDWALDVASQRFLMRHNVAKKEKLTFFEKTINLTKVEIGKAVIENGTPILMVNFETNKLMTFTDKNGNIVESEGSPKPDEVYKVYHQWAVFRDTMEPEPSAAWRVSECEEYANKLAF